MENQYYQQTIYYRRAVGEIAESRIRFSEISLRFFFLISSEEFKLRGKNNQKWLSEAKLKTRDRFIIEKISI